MSRIKWLFLIAISLLLLFPFLIYYNTIAGIISFIGFLIAIAIWNMEEEV